MLYPMEISFSSLNQLYQEVNNTFNIQIMDALKLKGTEDTPTVNLDAAANIFELSGKSMPENVAAFYGPILAWIDEYGKKPNAETVVSFKLEYFNTASSKMIMD